MTLFEALDRVHTLTGTSAEYLLLRQAVRALSEPQVREIEALCKADAAYDNGARPDGTHPAHDHQ